MHQEARQHLEEIGNFFEANARHYGTIDLPSKNGLIFLASKGKEIWNYWAERTNCKIDFSDHAFGPELDFSGFCFPAEHGGTSFKNCNFSRGCFAECTFKGDADFTGATLSDADFIDCKFFGNADFRGCKFFAKANFTRSYFSAKSFFQNSEFKQGVDFSSAQFHKEFFADYASIDEKSHFNGCTFHAEVSILKAAPIAADFSESIFLGRLRLAKCKIHSAEFSDAKFFEDSYFNESVFIGASFFRDCEFRKHASFRGCTFSDHTEFDRTKFHQKLNFSCNLQESEPKDAVKVWNISFRGCEFIGVANFDNRNFVYKCDFGPAPCPPDEKFLPAHFHKAPTFHGCNFHQDTTFFDSKFEQDYGDAAARSYRTFKLASERLKAIRDEQRFFQMEMKAEKPSLTGWKRLVSSTYENLSDYGFSLGKPLKFWLLSLLLFGAMHGWLANKAAGASGMSAAIPHIGNLWSDRTQQTLQYVAINAIPAPGLDRKSSELRENIYASNGAPGWVSSLAILVEMIHKSATLVCLFLIGLSIRNLLKMKS